jgi:two-component system, NarL family, invasion response regulator UvrY
MKRILLADDHHFVRLGLLQILRDEYPSAELVEVSDGDSLVKEATSKDWDLLITDLDMPGKSGLEALEQVKQLKPNLPIIILSIYPEGLYAVRALKAGASGYLNKNSAPDELIKAIERIKLGRKYISPELAEKLLEQKDTDSPHQRLTNREFEIFKLLAIGKSTSEIAETLSLALTTISTHRIHILEKLGLSNNADLTRYAVSHHLINDIKNNR